MDVEAILGVVTKGLNVAGNLLEAGLNAQPTVAKLIEVTTKGTSVTQEELDALEAQLDKQLAELEAPLDDA